MDQPPGHGTTSDRPSDQGYPDVPGNDFVAATSNDALAAATDQGYYSSYFPAWNANASNALLSPYHSSSLGYYDSSFYAGQAGQVTSASAQAVARQPGFPLNSYYDSAFGNAFNSASYDTQLRHASLQAQPASQAQVYRPASALHQQHVDVASAFSSHAAGDATISPNALQKASVQSGSIASNLAGGGPTVDHDQWGVETKQDGLHATSLTSGTALTTTIQPTTAPSLTGNNPQQLTHLPNGLVELSQAALGINQPASPLPGAPFALVSGSVDLARSRAITIPTLTPRRSFNELERLKPGIKSVLQRNMRGSRSKRRGQSVRARRAPKTRVTPSQNSQREPETETESETESDSDQTVSADSSEETEEVEASPLPASRPMDPVKAIEYDTTKALWRPSSRAVSSADMEATLKTFWEVVRPIREQWMVLEKEDAGKKGSDESLKVKFASELQKLKSALETAVRVSHRMILESLGVHAVLIGFLCRVLRYHAKGDEHSGESVVAIFSFLSSTNLSTKLLEQVKFHKLQARFEKKGSDEVRQYLKKISDKAAQSSATAEATKVAPAEAKTENQGDSSSTSKGRVSDRPTAAGKQPSSSRVRAPAATASEAAAGDKRGRDSPTESVIPSKKPASRAGTSSPALSSKSTSRGRPSGSAAPATASGGATRPRTSQTATGTAGTARSRTAQPPTRSAQFAEYIHNTSTTRPAVTAGQAGAASSSTSGPRARSTAPARPQFSIIATLDDLARSREISTPAQPKPAAPEETPEQKEKRLRREQRRKLVLRFADDDNLNQIRYINTNREDDNEGESGNLVRDAGDAKGEGLMFKEQLSKQKQGLDEDDEDDTPYSPPPEISDLYESGTQEEKSPESNEQPPRAAEPQLSMLEQAHADMAKIEVPTNPNLRDYPEQTDEDYRAHQHFRNVLAKTKAKKARMDAEAASKKQEGEPSHGNIAQPPAILRPAESQRSKPVDGGASGRVILQPKTQAREHGARQQHQVSHKPAAMSKPPAAPAPSYAPTASAPAAPAAPAPPASPKSQTPIDYENHPVIGQLLRAKDKIMAERRERGDTSPITPPQYGPVDGMAFWNKVKVARAEAEAEKAAREKQQALPNQTANLPTYQQAQPNPAVAYAPNQQVPSAPVANLEQILAALRQATPASAPVQPAPSTPTARELEWFRQLNALQQNMPQNLPQSMPLLQGFGNFNQAQGPFGQQNMPLFPGSGNPSQAQGQPGLQNILSSLLSGPPSQAQVQPGLQNILSSLVSGPPSQAPATTSATQLPSYSTNQPRHNQDEGSQSNASSHRDRQQGGNNGGEGRRRHGGHHREGRRHGHKSNQPCYAFAKGSCPYGEYCKYRH